MKPILSQPGSTKLIYTYFLNRINTVTGKRYGDDPTILAWETGNELQYKGRHPAPGSWTGKPLDRFHLPG